MEFNTGFSNLSYGQNARFLNQAINKLRECGSEAILGEMPKIAIIGNQSAGKSSLIEAMSGIRVPRKAGTCTRCPLEVVMFQSCGETGSWSCQISLRFMYDKDGVPLAQPQTVPFGTMLHDPDEVEKSLRRAQDAVLHLPFLEGCEAEQFLHGDYESIEEQIGFSRNVVRLEIWAPDLVDVTFIDLPGIISNANRKCVDIVTNLVSDYISQPDCLILVAVNMADDIENQGAASLARRFDKQGRRTIGVLTKADNVTDEERFERWRSIIAGEDRAHRLAHGYYLTMQRRPGATATRQECLHSEIRFFETSPHWAGLGLQYQKFIGTIELRRKLSNELTALIKTRIPALIQEVDLCVKKTNEELKLLPRPVGGAPQSFLLQICRDFVDDMSSRIRGENDQKELAMQIEDADERFMVSVKYSVAQFGLADHEELQLGVSLKSANDFLFEKKSTSIPNPAVNIKSAGSQRSETPPNEDDDVVDITPTKARRKTSTNAKPVKPQPDLPQTPPEDSAPGIVSTGEYIHLEELRGMIRREKARKLPGSVSESLRERLIRRAITPWEQCAEKYLEEVYKSVRDTAAMLCGKHFGRFEGSGLFTFIWQTVDKVMTDLQQHALAAISEQIRIEYRPFTKNKEYFESTFATLFKAMSEYRRTVAAGTKAARMSSLVPHDDYYTEIDLIAKVLAYVNPAYKRFVDIIPMRVDSKFQQPLITRIQKMLLETLLTGDGVEERCRAYLQDSPEVVAKRKELEGRLEVLRKADQEVRKFQQC